MAGKKETGVAVRPSTAVAKEVNEETLALLADSYPVEQGMNRILLPRLGLVSQDKTEEVRNPKTGKKEIKVITEAGTFYIEHQTDEVDENGKKVWNREELGGSLEGIILFQRKQLKMYDEKTELYTSSPIYDRDDEVLPLFCDKSEVARGTPAELKAGYQFTDDNGKQKSKLEDNRILYVEYNGEVFQMNLRGSSMYSFLTYARKTLPNAVVTEFSSEAKEKGTINWNQMTFTPKRKLTQKEAEVVVEKCQEIKGAINAEKAQYASNTIDVEVIKNREQAEKDFKNF